MRWAKKATHRSCWTMLSLENLGHGTRRAPASPFGFWRSTGTDIDSLLVLLVLFLLLLIHGSLKGPPMPLVSTKHISHRAPPSPESPQPWAKSASAREARVSVAWG